MQQEKKKAILSCILCSIPILIFAFCLWFGPQKEYSKTERRPYSTKPAFQWDSIMQGKYMSSIESFTMDQFPLRDRFRSMKAYFSYYVLQKKENHGIYLADGQLSKAEYPLNKEMLAHSTSQIATIYQQYLQNTNCHCFITIIPDKNYYLAKQNGYPSMDYAYLYNYVANNTSMMKMIDIRDTLSSKDYYSSDIHWKQECLEKTTEKICQNLNVSYATDYQVNTLQAPFYGVYHGQSALSFPADKIHYLTNDILVACNVINYSTGTGKPSSLYDFSKGNGKDPYELYLSGNQALVVIENPNATTNRELILFRDSFGSSLAPLLVSDYRTITLVDIRYINLTAIDRYITFTDQDVYFLYSTLVFNSSAL